MNMSIKIKNEVGISSPEVNLHIVFTALLFFLFGNVLLPTILSTRANAAEITLSWNRNTEPDIAGYKIFYGTRSHNYNSIITINDTSTEPAQCQYTVHGLQEGQTYFFALKSFDLAGNISSYSSEVIRTIKSNDTDGDGISDSDEITIYTTSPNKSDTDGDGLSDGDEISYWGSLWNEDSDGDGIINLLDSDSDNDGFSDGMEVNYGYDPNDPDSLLEYPPLEYGNLEVNNEWQHVNFQNPFVDPIVIVASFSLNGNDPAVPRIRNITQTGFDIRIQEWNYLDGYHSMETVGYLVMEKGSYELDNGIRIEAGTFQTDKTASFTHVNFNQEFNTPPVVITTVSSANGSDAVTCRIKNATTTGFDFRMQEQEHNTQTHATELISYVAWEPGEGVIDDVTYLVAKTDNKITDDAYEVNFPKIFNNTPVFLAEMQTTNGSDPANTRWEYIDSSKVRILIDEEQSKDKETAHASEIVGYMTFTPSDKKADLDGDGLTNEEELQIYSTNPELFDTDGDGLSDGDEISYWGSLWNEDSDGDGIINLLDSDSDNDGFSDGMEVNYGYDPNDPDSLLEYPPLEYGNLEVNNEWQHVNFQNPFVDPIVIVASFSLNGNDPAVPRIRNITQTGFDIRIQEWNYLDGYHSMETVGYLVMEKGSYELDNGIRIEAGTFQTDKTASFTHVNFNQEFNTPPVVITTVSSANGSDAVTCRIKNATTTGFDFRMQEQEHNTQTHATELISYVAWEPGEGVIDDVTYLVAKTDNKITDDAYEVNFPKIFNNTPVFLAEMQTTNGSDPANTRWEYIDSSKVRILIDEEQSKDKETAHASEIVGYMTFLPLNQ